VITSLEAKKKKKRRATIRISDRIQTTGMYD